MRDDLSDLFENFGTKRVSKTDKEKGAFVLNEAQKEVMAAAGFAPGEGGDNAVMVELAIPNDSSGSRLSVSYYNSVRKDPSRNPEARMGREIVHWMQIGDEIVLANLGTSVFVWKENEPALTLGEMAGKVAAKAEPARLLERARQAEGKPERKDRTVVDFQRSSAVVAGVIARSGGHCEMPQCARETFNRPDGSTYLEVHHITPLAEGGDDTMANAAALCPTCHRELHHGGKRLDLRPVLKSSVFAKEQKD